MANRAKVRIRDFPLISPRDCARIAPDRRGIHGRAICAESGKGHSGAYNSVIIYHVRDRGGTLQGEGVMPSYLIQSYQLQAKGRERAREARPSYQRGHDSADPHPTRLHPHLRLRAAARWEKYPLSKIISQNVNGRMRYQPPIPPPSCSFLLYPLPPSSRDVRPSQIFCWLYKPDSPLSHFCAIV